jgi:hypothetical protein
MANLYDSAMQAMGDLLGIKYFKSPIPSMDILDSPGKIEGWKKRQAWEDKLDQLQSASRGIKNEVLGLSTQAQAKSDLSYDPNYQVPGGTDLAMSYLKQQAGGKEPTQYYKAFKDPNFIPKIQAAEKLRSGLGNLLLLQAFHESTLGNANNNNNIFGALPGGEGSGKAAQFQNPSDAVDYQLSPNVLGGGANPNMNVLNESTPLTLGRVKKLYKSYNPEGDYINTLLQILAGQQK